MSLHFDWMEPGLKEAHPWIRSVLLETRENNDLFGGIEIHYRIGDKFGNYQRSSISLSSRFGHGMGDEALRKLNLVAERMEDENWWLRVNGHLEPNSDYVELFL